MPAAYGQKTRPAENIAIWRLLIASAYYYRRANGFPQYGILDSATGKTWRRNRCAKQRPKSISVAFYSFPALVALCHGATRRSIQPSTPTAVIPMTMNTSAGTNVPAVS